MSADTQTRGPTVVEWIPLDRLEPPETDVRTSRDRDQVRSIAQSLERSGQLQPAKVYPSNIEDLGDPAEATQADLREIAASAEPLTVVDGWTRREAARLANWDRLRCEIHPDRPTDQVVESLDANTERIDMDDYETMVAIRDWQNETGKTQREVAEKLGKAPSTISNWFRALDGFGPAVQCWRDPETHVEYGHVREIESLPNEKLKKKVLQDCMEFERSVAMLRQTCQNTVRGWKRQQQDQRSQEQKTQDGTAKRAEREAKKAASEAEEVERCKLCGGKGGHRIAISTCKEDYGLLTRLKESGGALLAEEGDQETSGSDPDE
jgi:ParB-like chromosome segregation protein Spo0J